MPFATIRTSSGGQEGRQRREWTKYDMYAFNPTYEWTSYKTTVGSVLSYVTIIFLVFYMFITTRDYVLRPPELVSQGDVDLLQTPQLYRFAIPKIGIRIGYTNQSSSSRNNNNPNTNRETVVALANNENPYVRFHFRHVVVHNQTRVQETELPVEDCIVSSIPSSCPVVNGTLHTLQGTFYKEQFEFLEITVSKCTMMTGDDGDACAPLSEINDKIASDQLRIRVQVSLEAEQFDVERYHTTGVGSSINNRSLEYFGLPNLLVQSDIFLKARVVSKEQRYAGSPPMPETESNILSFDRRETNYRPLSLPKENTLLEFSLRLDDNVGLEEVSYWCPSILDLFGLWGAMASFAASLSIGCIAMAYNKWSFHRHFARATMEKRREAQKLTASAMEFMRQKGAGDNHHHSSTTTIRRSNRQEIYQSLQHQYDALMVEPDLRLFESHHFDVHGRVAMSAAELKFPSTAFGELRRLAILEHGKKKRAAVFLSLWYGRWLVKKGFIHDQERQRELFSIPDAFAPAAAATHNDKQQPTACLPLFNNQDQSHRRRRQRTTLRRRKAETSSSNSAHHDVPVRNEWSSSSSCSNMESGVILVDGGGKSRKTKENRTDNDVLSSSSSSNIEVPLGYGEGHDGRGNGGGRDESVQRALEVIAALDPMTNTDE